MIGWSCVRTVYLTMCAKRAMVAQWLRTALDVGGESTGQLMEGSRSGDVMAMLRCYQEYVDNVCSRR
jgi:hypothetical protein